MAVPMPRDPDAFEQAMISLSADATAAFNRGDVAACAALYVNDATLFLPDRPPIRGREAIEAVLKEFVSAGAKLVSVDPIAVGSSGGLGYYSGTYRLDRPADDGSTMAESGKFISVLEFQADGSWRAVIDSLIGDTPSGPN